MIIPAPGPSVVSAFDFVLFGILGWPSWTFGRSALCDHTKALGENGQEKSILEQSRKADMIFGRGIVFSCRAASNFTSSSRSALAGILP